jgi:flagellar protein FlgJ
MNMVLKSMRQAVPQSGLLDSQNEKLYLSMFDQQLTQNLSGRGVGLAEAMLAQLSRSLASAAPEGEGQPEGLSLAPPPGFALKPQAGIPLGSAPTMPPVAPVPRRGADLSLYQSNGDRPAPATVASLQGQVDGFVNRMGASAQAASEASGVPAPLILAQAALESGWGKREIRADDGTQSYNLFGIKADRGWKGPVVETTTTEYVDGEPQKVRAKFRAYGSYEEAFTDYAKFITRNPRYANVLATDDPAEAAHGLQKAGYATDPQYGQKLVRIMQKFT